MQVYADPVFTTTLPAERNAALDEGAWLEVLSAFTTPAMPPTLAFEAEMTMGASGTFDGYDSADPDAPIGSISPGNTFGVGGVQYTVDTVGFNTDSNEFELRVDPALPFDSLTLTLAANQFPVLVKNTGQSDGGRRILSSGNPKRAQAFTTGSSTDGYTLGSIGLYLGIVGSVADIPHSGNELTVTLNAVDEDGNPDDGSVLCTLTDPASFSTGLHLYTFSPPTTGTPCPTLAASTTYFVVIERVVPTHCQPLCIGIEPTASARTTAALRLVNRRSPPLLQKQRQRVARFVRGPQDRNQRPRRRGSASARVSQH